MSPCDRAGMGNIVWSHSRDRQGSTHSLNWGRGWYGAGVSRGQAQCGAHGTAEAEHMGKGRKIGDKRKGGSGKGVQGMSTQWGPLLLRVAGRGPHMKR